MGENVKLLRLVRPDLILIVGSDALALFDYFEVDELHGLNRADCIKRIQEGGTYIDGMSNVVPKTDSSKIFYYIFINMKAWKLIKVYNFGLVFHEATHYAFSKYWNNLQEDEEQLITEAENLGIDIYKLISGL